MEKYLVPIRVAALTFPFVALFFTLPYMIAQYRKFERIPLLKVVIAYSFIFYMMTAYFLTILPLPSREAVAAMDASGNIVLEPLESMRDYLEKSNLSFEGKTQILAILRSAPALQLAFNVLLLLPFGMYLRYYFRRTWWQTLLMSAGLSLFYELTQLSGLYGIYAKPYRVFEVDDLICNTLGGMAGFLLAPALHAFLPNRAELDQRALRVTSQVSVVRRILATLIDWVVVGVPYVAIAFAVGDLRHAPALEVDAFVLSAVACAVVYETVCLTASGGYTPGKRLFRLRILGESGGRAGFFQYAARSFLLYGVIFAGPVLAFLLLYRLGDWPTVWQYAGGAAVAGLAVLYGMFLVETVLKLFGASRPYRYDVVCRTRCVSVVKKQRKKGAAQAPEGSGETAA